MTQLFRNSFAEISKKLPVKGIASFTLSPGPNPKLAAYIPEAKSVPATILIYPYSGFPKDNNGAVLAAMNVVHSVNLFQIQQTQQIERAFTECLE